MKEEFKRLEKYSGLYSVHSAGYIFEHRQGKFLKIYYSYGHPVVRLLGKRFFVAELVAETFIPRPKGTFLVRHRDGNILNNCVENLEWYQEDKRTPHYILERKTKQRRLQGRRATYHLRKRIEVQERNKYGHWVRIDVVLGINNTAKKYGVPRSTIYKHCNHHREKKAYEREPWRLVYDDDRKRKERSYQKDKIYKNRLKFRELDY